MRLPQFKRELKSFCRNFFPTLATSKVVLGLSGGPDSAFLLYSLIHFLKMDPELIKAVHIDHNWRPESAHEAQEVQRFAESLGVSCDVVTLKASKKGNLEDWSRNET